jgi:hypothetical protein
MASRQSRGSKENSQKDRQKERSKDFAQSLQTDGAIRRFLLPLSIQVCVLTVGFLLYLQLHRANLYALVFGDARGFLPHGFTFIGSDRNIGSALEVMFGATLAATLRTMKAGLGASRRKDFSQIRYLVVWVVESALIVTIAIVIVFCLRLFHIIIGGTLDFHLDTADAAVFTALGFLLGFYNLKTKTILFRIEEQTLGLYAKKHRTQSQNSQEDQGT